MLGGICFKGLFIDLFIYSFIHLFIYSFIHLFIYSFIHLLIYSFIRCSFIYFWSSNPPSFEYEIVRQNIPERSWRVTYINAAYEECPTYPNKLIVPATISDEELKEVFSYRSKGRVPALTYYHLNGAAMTRSSQPMPGMTYKTCSHDERFVLFCVFLHA